MLPFLMDTNTNIPQDHPQQLITQNYLQELIKQNKSDSPTQTDPLSVSFLMSLKMFYEIWFFP